MVRGFYQLGSGLLAQNKVLNAIGNNISNAKTGGFKKQEVITSTFENMMVNRVDGQKTEIGGMSMARIVGDTATIHTQGTMETTGRSLDFAIEGEGFFAMQGQNGTVYTRKGDFNVDAQGYLIHNNGGRVLGTNGPIMVGTDNFTADSGGNIYVGGNYRGTLAVYNFEDYNSLQEAGGGFYTGNGANITFGSTVRWQTLEGSNVNVAEEMTDAIATQRGLQSCSQVLKMYDQVLSKTNEIGRI